MFDIINTPFHLLLDKTLDFVKQIKTHFPTFDSI